MRQATGEPMQPTKRLNSRQSNCGSRISDFFSQEEKGTAINWTGARTIGYFELRFVLSDIPNQTKRCH
jgi:hypothetical protein